MPIPLIIPALVAAAGTIAGASIQASSAKKNRISQEKQNAIDRKRAATAYQTAVSDMRAAGMNPITGQNPPQAASTPMPAPQSDMSGVGQVIQAGSSAIGDLLQRNQQTLQDQAMSFYQNQVNSTNDMINHLQDITHQYQSDLNQTISGLSEDAKAYLREVEQQHRESKQKISEISDSQQFSVEQLSKFGITVSQKDTESESNTESEKDTRNVNIGFSAGFSLKDFLNVGVNASGDFGHEEGKQKTKQNSKEKSAQGQAEAASGIRYVSGREVKNALTQYSEDQYNAKLQDSGSEKINEQLKTIDRSSYRRLSDDLVKAQVELVNHRRYAADLRSHPGKYLESYGKFVDGLNSNNENPYQAPSTSQYEQYLKSKYSLYESNYPTVLNFKEKHPEWFDVMQRSYTLSESTFKWFFGKIKNDLESAESLDRNKKKGFKPQY